MKKTIQKTLWRVVIWPVLLLAAFVFLLDKILVVIDSYLVVPGWRLLHYVTDKAIEETWPQSKPVKVAEEQWSMTAPFPEAGQCGCHMCCWLRYGRSPSWMAGCSVCGNKRCPKATNHLSNCTHSNEVGQPGSVYGDEVTIIDVIKEIKKEEAHV